VFTFLLSRPLLYRSLCRNVTFHDTHASTDWNQFLIEAAFLRTDYWWRDECTKLSFLSDSDRGDKICSDPDKDEPYKSKNDQL
jgi:hypothetical protein